MENIVSNRKLLDNDNSEMVDHYIDEICSESKFLCKNKEMCGKNSSIYTNTANIEKICKNIKEANKCENQIDECVVMVKNRFDDSIDGEGGGTGKTIITSFVNLIVPIPNAFDEYGNIKFLRLPPLSSSRKKGSLDICNICKCMNRFAKSPGGGENSSTSPGQNECIYSDTFEHYYYPLYIENINSRLTDAPVIKLGKHNIINSNIIYANSQEDLNVTNLYDILLRNKISKTNIKHFILNILYKNNIQVAKELQLYLLNKNKKKGVQKDIYKSYEDFTLYFIVFIIFLIFVIFILIQKSV